MAVKKKKSGNTSTWYLTSSHKKAGEIFIEGRGREKMTGWLMFCL
jgi:hypothetical protein